MFKRCDVFPERIVVRVTNDDIEQGVRCSSRSYAFALAAQRQFPGRVAIVQHAALTLTVSSADQEDDVKYMGTPELLQFLLDFDYPSQNRPQRQNFELKRVQ